MDSSEPGGALPFRMDAAVVGTDMRGDRISGAPSGVAAVRRGVVVRPGIAGDRSLCVSAAAAATRLHSSSQAKGDYILKNGVNCVLFLSKILKICMMGSECKSVRSEVML